MIDSIFIYIGSCLFFAWLGQSCERRIARSHILNDIRMMSKNREIGDNTKMLLYAPLIHLLSCYYNDQHATNVLNEAKSQLKKIISENNS